MRRGAIRKGKRCKMIEDTSDRGKKKDVRERGKESSKNR